MIVKFIMNYTPYAIGDIADIDKEVANVLINDKLCEEVVIKATKSNATNKEVITDGTNKPGKGKGKTSNSK